MTRQKFVSSSSIVSAACCAVALSLVAGCAQSPATGDLLSNVMAGLPPTGAGPAAPPVAGARPQPSLPSSSSAATAAAAAVGAAPVNAKKDIRAEVAPDRTCSRPQEKFNVWEKVVEYGGAEASLRLQRLISSDFKYDDITPQDRQMLRYLAQTTVWVPVELENTLARSFDRLTRKNGELSELDEEALKRMGTRLDLLHQQVKDFPGNAKLSVNPEIADGAYARFGGLIQLSPRFLALMDQHPTARDLVLAHELSHVYKRHAVKQMQFELLSSREGFELTKKVLARAQLGASVNPLQDGIFVATVVPQIITFVRGMQLGFSREQELEADACAVEWMHRAKIDTCAAWSGFQVIAPQAGAPRSPYFDTHPTSKEREANYVKRIAGLPCAAGPAKPAPDKPAPAKPGAVKPVLPATPAAPKPKKAT